MSEVTRRQLLRGAAGAAGLFAVGAVAGCTRSTSAVAPSAHAVRRTEATRRGATQRLVTARLTARPVAADLGGRVVYTWGYDDSLPGPLLRAQAGDLLRVTVSNELPASTSIHWHGIALRNDMDGVPGVTQDPIAPGGTFTYEFTVPDPGTYFYHPHSGVQLDRGLYGALIVDDPREPGDYDEEWLVVLDDWIDGTGRNPEQVLRQLLGTAGKARNPMGGMDHGGMGDMAGMDHGSMGGMDMGGMDMGGAGGMGGMGHGSMGGERREAMGEAMESPLLGGAGDVAYPLYLVNGKTAGSPASLRARPGQRVRMRIVNAGADTAFRVALGGHRMLVTHSDGFPVNPVMTDALLLGMGERYDVLIDIKDGAFPLVASAEGKKGQGFAVARTGAGPTPRGAPPAELKRKVVLGSDLTAPLRDRLPNRAVDRTHDLLLGGTMSPYRWTINGQTFSQAPPLPVMQGERVRLRFHNRSTMFHPMHVHGHTFGLVGGGLRKDTVIVGPMRSVEVDLDANNPGQWATHCHNIYHAEAGMMTMLSYQA